MGDLLFNQLWINLFFQTLPWWFIAFMDGITNLGSEIFYLLFMPFLYWCVNSAIGLRVGAMLLFSNAIVTWSKLLLRWPRPYWIDASVTGYAQEITFGIPSGHATNAASVWGVLGVSIKRTWSTILIIVLILLIGLSRIVLGVHFLTDVVVGWALGALLLLVFLRLEDPVVAWFNKLVLKQQIFVAIFSSFLLILPTMLWIWFLRGYEVAEAWQLNAGHVLTPLDLHGIFTIGGTWAGFISGYAWLNKRYAKYLVEGKIVLRFVRYIIGISGVILLWSGLGVIFPDTENALGLSLRYIRYFAIGAWISAAAPLLFRKFKLARFSDD